MKAPRFWQSGEETLQTKLLAPISKIYNAASSKRANQKAKWTAPIPVICIGNLTMGGAGKTPTAISIAQYLKTLGKSPYFLSRGYGGSTKGPIIVADQSAKEVGDEPLLLKQCAPVCVSRDRVAGAELCLAAGADVIIMDDGFQNPHLHKDISILVVDGGFGHGNEKVFPAGPLREELETGLLRANAALIIGEDTTNSRVRLHSLFPNLPILSGNIQPLQETNLNDKSVVAFAGIGRPEKFFETVACLGANIKDTMAFADHHAFSPTDLQKLSALAQKHDAQLVTTEKDWVRLPSNFQKDVEIVKISLAWDDPDVLKAVLSPIFD